MPGCRRPDIKITKITNGSMGLMWINLYAAATTPAAKAVRKGIAGARHIEQEEESWITRMQALTLKQVINQWNS